MIKASHRLMSEHVFTLLTGMGHGRALPAADVVEGATKTDYLLDIELVDVDLGLDNPHKDALSSDDDAADHEYKSPLLRHNYTAFSHFIDIRKGPGRFDDYDGYSYSRGSGSVDERQHINEITSEQSFWIKDVAGRIPDILAYAAGPCLDEVIAYWFNDHYVHVPGEKWYRRDKCSPAIERYSYFHEMGRYATLEDECAARFPVAHSVGETSHGFPYSIFMPIDNLARYWYDLVVFQGGEPSSLGHVLHAIQDAAVPHHAAGCLGNWHGEYEIAIHSEFAKWVEDADFNEAVMRTFESWLRPDPSPPSTGADVARWRRPASNWRIDMLVTWMALNAYESYVNVYYGFSPDWKMNLDDARDLSEKMVALCMLALYATAGTEISSEPQPDLAWQLMAGSDYGDMLVQSIVFAPRAPSGAYVLGAVRVDEWTNKILLYRNGEMISSAKYRWSATITADKPYVFSFPGYMDIAVANGSPGTRNLHLADQEIFHGGYVVKEISSELGSQPSQVRHIAVGAAYDGMRILSIVFAPWAPPGAYVFGAVSLASNGVKILLFREGQVLSSVQYEWTTMVAAGKPYEFSFPGYMDIVIANDGPGVRDLHLVDQEIFHGGYVEREIPSASALSLEAQATPTRRLKEGGVYDGLRIRSIVFAPDVAPGTRCVFRVINVGPHTRRIQLYRDGQAVSSVKYSWMTMVSADSPYVFSFPGCVDIEIGNDGPGACDLRFAARGIFHGGCVVNEVSSEAQPDLVRELRAGAVHGGMCIKAIAFAPEASPGTYVFGAAPVGPQQNKIQLFQGGKTTSSVEYFWATTISSESPHVFSFPGYLDVSIGKDGAGTCNLSLVDREIFHGGYIVKGISYEPGKQPGLVRQLRVGFATNDMRVKSITFSSGAPPGTYVFGASEVSPHAMKITLFLDGQSLSSVEYLWSTTISSEKPYVFSFLGYLEISIGKDGAGTRSLYLADQEVFHGGYIIKG